MELSRSKLHKTGDLQIGNWHVNCQHSSYFSFFRSEWMPSDCVMIGSFVFTARRYASAIYAVVACLSVCLSVRLSQVIVLSKRLNVASRKQRPETWVLWRQRSRRTPIGSLQQRRQIHVHGVVSNRRFSTNIWLSQKTVQDRDNCYCRTLIENRIRSVEWCYFRWPWVTPNYPKSPDFPHFVSPFIIHIFAKGGDGDF